MFGAGTGLLKDVSIKKLVNAFLKGSKTLFRPRRGNV